MKRSERRLAAYLDRLVAGRRPHPFQATPEELAAMTAAVELAAARTGADYPDPGFVERLGRRLRSELEGDAGAPAPAPAVSRRTLLWTAGGSAAAAVLGAVADHTLVTALSAREAETVVPNAGSWRPVAAVQDLPEGQALPVDTGSMRVLLANDGGRIHALSGVCTHLGCTLQPSPQGGALDCPCHRTSFSLSGKVLHYQLARSPGDLPEVQSRVRDGQVEVFVV